MESLRYCKKGVEHKWDLWVYLGFGGFDDGFGGRMCISDE